MTRLTVDEIKELIAKLSPISSISQQKLIDAEQSYAFIKRYLTDAMRDGHRHPKVLIDTILKLKNQSPPQQISELQRGANYKASDAVKAQAHAVMEKIIDEQITLDTPEAMKNLHSISRQSLLPQPIVNRAHAGWLKLKKVHEVEVKRPPLKQKEAINIDTVDELEIEDEWQICQVDVEHSTHAIRLLTFVVAFKTDEYVQHIVIKEKTTTQFDELKKKLKQAKFRRGESRTMREWIYQTYNRM